MSSTPKLGLTEWTASVASPWLLHNLALRELDQNVNMRVKSMALTAPPGSEAEGDAYIVAPGATGDWAGQDNNLAHYVNGAYAFITVQPGTILYNDADGLYYSWDGTEFSGISAGATYITNASLEALAVAGNIVVNQIYRTDEDKIAIGKAADKFIISAAFTEYVADNLPAAVDDGPFVFSGTTPVTTTNLTANDNLGDGVDLATGVSYVAASLAGTGTLGADPIYNGDGTFTYTPSGSETSDVTFDYRITDTDGDTSDGTVTLELDLGVSGNHRGVRLDSFRSGEFNTQHAEMEFRATIGGADWTSGNGGAAIGTALGDFGVELSFNDNLSDRWAHTSELDAEIGYLLPSGTNFPFAEVLYTPHPSFTTSRIESGIWRVTDDGVTYRPFALFPSTYAMTGYESGTAAAAYAVTPLDLQIQPGSVTHLYWDVLFLEPALRSPWIYSVAGLQFLDGAGADLTQSVSVTVTSHTAAAGQPATNATDNNAATHFQSDSTLLTRERIQVEFATAQAVRGIKLQARDTNAANETPRSFILRGSDDGTNWVNYLIADRQGGWTNGEIRQFDIPSS